jgi:PAS domain S-box-containing protein
MPTPATSADDEGRLEEPWAQQLLASPMEPEFDNLTQLASDICDAPVALISVVAQDRVWFKSRVGFDDLHGPREHSFCSHAVQGTGPLVVEDAAADPRFQANVYVEAAPGVRFYAGIPLILSSGQAVGTLCVIDYKARTLSDKQLGNLQKLARQVTALMEAKRIALRLQEEDRHRLLVEQRLDFALQAADIGDWDMDLRTNVARRSLKHDQCFGYTEAVPEWGYDTFLAHVIDADRARVDSCYQRAMAGLGVYDVEFRVLWPDQTLHWLWSKGRFYFDDTGKPNRVAGIQVDITKRKETEENLRESEYRWRFAIEGSGDGLWDWDIQNNHVFYSERWLAMLGLEKNLAAHDPQVWSSHLHPQDKDRVLAQVQSHLDGQTPHYACEHRVICSDGCTKWMLGRGLVVQRSDEGRPLRMIGTNSDITARKEAEAALNASNAQLQLLEVCVARLNDIVMITEAEPFDQPGPRIVFVNDAFVRRTGYSREEVIGKTPRLLQGAKTQRSELERIGAALRRWEPVRAELINYTKAGDEMWLELDIVPIADAHGWYTHWVAVERDITERKQIQDALHTSEARRKIAMDSGRVAVWEVHLNPLQMIWDDNCFALYQIRKEDFKGEYEEWTRSIHPQDLGAVERVFQNAVAGIGTYDLTYRIVWHDGSVRHIQAYGEVVRGEDGHAERLIGTNWDVTEQKLNEEALQSSLQEKSALLKEVHHRVKNNLQVITSLLRLESRRSAVEDTKAVLGEMQARIRAMALLHESLYRSGTFASVDLGSYLRQLATQAFQTQSTNSGAVQLALNLGSVQVSMDQAIPCGLLINELISNCLKHGFPEGAQGQVSVDLQPHEGAHQWCLRVSDTGVGLPPDFEARRQNSLGLLLVGDLARQIGGELQITPNPDQGVSFTVIFMAQEPKPLVMPD